jgi:hypothetical protein
MLPAVPIGGAPLPPGWIVPIVPPVSGAPLPAVPGGLPFTPEGACMQPNVPGVQGGLVFVEVSGSSLAQAEAKPRAPTASSVQSRVEIDIRYLQWTGVELQTPAHLARDGRPITDHPPPPFIDRKARARAGCA